MIRRYRMPFAMNDPAHPQARVPAHKMDILRPNEIAWFVTEHDATHVTIQLDSSDAIHMLLVKQPDVEVIS